MLAACAPLLLSVQPFARKIVVPAGAALPPIATGDTLTGQQLAQTFTAEAAVTDDTLYEQLRDGGWRPLTGRDLELSAALNAGYLLRVALDRRRRVDRVGLAAVDVDSSPVGHAVRRRA